MQLQLAVQEWKVEQEAGMGAGLGAQGHTVPHVAAAVAGGWLCPCEDTAVPSHRSLCSVSSAQILGNAWR